MVASNSEVLSRDDQYVLNRIYHTKTFEDGNHFHRRIMYICDIRGDIVNNVALVQYCFEVEERDFDLKPHGNSTKDGAQGFTRTQSSTLATLKEKCATLGPREAVRQTKASSGGVTKVESSAQMPRGLRQAKYLRKTVTSTQQQFGGRNDDDEVLSVLYRMKEEDSSFIRNVSIGKEGLSIVLASDVQLAEMEKFCIEEMMFAVMQIDPTFNLGPYECTPISYQNLLLERKSTGKPPVFVGPVLIHYKKDERTYMDFLNKLKALRAGLQDIISFGTDGEMALVNALQSCFPKATEKSLRCFRHFRQNVEAMLHKTGIKGTSANQYLWEIFGKVSSDGCYETGLLDSESDGDFDALLDSIKPVWSGRENGLKVFEFIMKKSEMMKKHMIAKVRRLVGLPSISSSIDIPVKFYTLEAESTNNRIKAKKQRKASGFMGTIEAIRSIDAEQQEDFALAVAGLHEDLQLRKEFAKFKRPDFLELSSREREKFLCRLRNTSLSRLLSEDLSSLLSGYSIKSSRKSSSTSTSLSKTEQTSSQPQLTLYKHQEIEVVDDDPRLCSLPAFTRQGIIGKANRILQSEQVFQGPLNGTTQWFSVGSFSADRPHQVAVKGVAGEVTCDCEGWRAQKCCAHALAVSQEKGMLSKYLDWCSTKNQANVTNIANMNVRRQALGRKAKDKLPRDRKKKEAPTVLVQNKSHSHRKSLPKDKSEHYRYRIVFLSETTAYKCYGCDSAMRCPPAVPESPENIALTTMEHRSFLRDGKLQVKFQRTYYHVRRDCILSKNDAFTGGAIVIDDQSRLDDNHKVVLERECDVKFKY